MSHFASGLARVVLRALGAQLKVPTTEGWEPTMNQVCAGGVQTDGAEGERVAGCVARVPGLEWRA